MGDCVGRWGDRKVGNGKQQQCPDQVSSDVMSSLARTLMKTIQRSAAKENERRKMHQRDTAKEKKTARCKSQGEAAASGFPPQLSAELSGFSHRVGCLCPACSATGTAVCLKGSPVKQRAPPAARRSAK